MNHLKHVDPNSSKKNLQMIYRQLYKQHAHVGATSCLWNQQGPAAVSLLCYALGHAAVICERAL